MLPGEVLSIVRAAVNEYVSIPTLSTCILRVQQFLLPLLKSSVTWLVNY